MIEKIKTIYFKIFRGLHTFVSYWSKYEIPPKPSVMYVELTYRCTCKCGFCERWKIGPKMSKNELTTNEWKTILTDAYRIGVRYVGFTGGEVFLRKDIFELGKFAKDLGLNVTVASNGTLINEKNVKKIGDTFDSITISMDGIEKETHDLIRGVKGVYDSAAKALFLLKEQRVPLAVNMVITAKNYSEIDKYIVFFEKRNIPIQLTPVHNYETSFLKVKEELRDINPGEFRKVWNNLSKKHHFLNNFFYSEVPTFFENPKKLLNKYTCFAGSVMFFLNPYGEVFPCEFNRVSMGSLRNEPLKKIWEKAKKLRKNISSSKRYCICWTHCVVPLNNNLSRHICWGTNHL